MTSWPTNKPEWGGTSGATGTGETKAVTFNTLSTSTSDYKTVTATCDNTVTVNVIVYQLTGKHVAQDNFSGRASTTYGVAEVTDLSFTVSPTGISASQMGGLSWEAVTANGTIANSGTSGTGTYTCYWTNESVTLRLVVQSGPSKNRYVDVAFTVVAPTGSYMIQEPSTGIWHMTNTCSVGFKGWIYIEPKTVSFSKIQFREGSCLSTATGFWARDNGITHPIGTWGSIGGGNSTTGCRVSGNDTIQSPAYGPPYSVGTFLWPIPWQYRVGTGGATQFDTANHYFTADANGKCCGQKAGAGPFCKNAADPTSGY